MSDDMERLNRVLDDLAAERDPRDRAALTPEDAELAEVAALLKRANFAHGQPDEVFVERLGERLSAARQGQEPAPERAEPIAPAPDLSRRRLIGRIAATAAGLAAGAGVGAAGGAAAAYDKGKRDGYRQGSAEPYDTPLVPGDRGQWLATGRRVADVAPGQAVRFRAGAVEGFVVNPGGGRPLYALSAACTHMGCLISWLDSAGTFLCPCHGAQYKPDGTVLDGVARHPLPRLRTHIGAEGRLYVWGVVAHPAVTTLAPYGTP